ncbi:hypothetical protein AgCh_036448 [Apium graveolens]
MNRLLTKLILMRSCALTKAKRSAVTGNLEELAAKIRDSRKNKGDGIKIVAGQAEVQPSRKCLNFQKRSWILRRCLSNWRNSKRSTARLLHSLQ